MVTLLVAVAVLPPFELPEFFCVPMFIPFIEVDELSLLELCFATSRAPPVASTATANTTTIITFLLMLQPPYFT